jgi:hypothetical protein
LSNQQLKIALNILYSYEISSNLDISAQILRIFDLVYDSGSVRWNCRGIVKKNQILPDFSEESFQPIVEL